MRLNPACFGAILLPGLISSVFSWPLATTVLPPSTTTSPSDDIDADWLYPWDKKEPCEGRCIKDGDWCGAGENLLTTCPASTPVCCLDHETEETQREKIDKLLAGINYTHLQVPKLLPLDYDDYNSFLPDQLSSNTSKTQPGYVWEPDYHDHSSSSYSHSLVRLSIPLAIIAIVFVIAVGAGMYAKMRNVRRARAAASQAHVEVGEERPCRIHGDPSLSPEVVISDRVILPVHGDSDSEDGQGCRHAATNHDIAAIDGNLPGLPTYEEVLQEKMNEALQLQDEQNQKEGDTMNDPPDKIL